MVKAIYGAAVQTNLGMVDANIETDSAGHSQYNLKAVHIPPLP